MGLLDRIMAKIGARGAASGSGLSYRSIRTTECSKADHSLSALSKFEQTIATWDREQARIALAILATGHGDRDPIESIFGKGVELRTAIGHLTMDQLNFVVSTMQEIYPDDLDNETD
jgi:hypothetical protein